MSRFPRLASGGGLTQISYRIDEEYKPKLSDPYALAKAEAELQADSFTYWYPGMKIASLRIHEVAPLKDVQKEHEETPESAYTQLWGWISPVATARACLLSCTSDKLEGHQSKAPKNSPIGANLADITYCE